MQKPVEETKSPELSPLKKAVLAIDRLQARVRELEERRHEPIAVVGIGCRFPGGASNPDTYASLLRNGVDAVKDAPPVDRPGLTEAIRAGGLPPAGYLDEDVASFDPIFFGIAPREAASMDPQQRLLLECAWEALEDAAINPRGLEGSRTGVYVGIAGTDWAQLQMRGVPTPEAIHSHFAAGVGHSMASGRLSYLLGLQGPSVSIDTACSSSLVALHLACQGLRNGECDLAVGAGVNLILAPDFTIAFQQTRMLSDDGRCRTFDAGATGFSRGEGCGVVVLKRLRDALRDGDRIHGVVRASAVNQDGPSSGLTAPNGPAQEAVIRAALEAGAIEPESVDYVEAHGTGTILGDPIEVQALGATYGRARSPGEPLMIGSVKTQLGHLEAAAGMAGFIKAVLAVRDDFVPGQLHFRTPNPHIPWDRLAVRVASEEGSFSAGRTRRAGVSSFGFSGTNVHVVVEEPPVAAPAQQSDGSGIRAVQVLPLAAASSAGLTALAASVEAQLEGDAVPFGDIAHTLATGRAPLRERLAVVADSPEAAREALSAWHRGEEATGIFPGRAAPEPPPVAFLYTGQGSQRPGMARELYAAEPVVREVLDRAATVLDAELGRPFLPLLFGEVADPETLHRTSIAQPAIVAVELAISALWRSWGIRPDRLLGHSVGEYAAAVDAGVMSFEDGLRLIAARGRLMDALPEGGAMVAIFASRERVEPLLAAYDGAASIAAVNAPASTVISGDEDAVLAIADKLLAEGAQNRRLKVSHAFHSRRMEPMLEEFRRVARQIRLSPPRITLISNVTGAPLTAADAIDPEYWVRHVRAPVMFADGIAAVRRAGVSVLLECGPEGVLTGMASRFLPPEEVSCIPTLRSGRGEEQALAEAAAALFAAGVDPDWRARDAGRPYRRVAVPLSRFDRTHLWYALPSSTGGTRPVASGPAWSDPHHPLIGAGLRTPDGEWLFERTLEPQTIPFIADHVVDGRVIVPATVHLEILLAAGSVASGTAELAVEGVTIREALVLDEGAPRSLLVRVVKEADGFRASIHSIGADEDDFRLHAEGRLLAASEEARTPLDRDLVEDRCADCVDGEEFYARLAQRGIDFGPTFRSVIRVEYTEGEALATLEAADGLDGGYRLHPALLDAAIQAMAVAVPGASDLYLPVEIGRLRILPEARDARFSHVQVAAASGAGRTLTGSLTLHDAEGIPVAWIDEIRLVPVPGRTAESATPVYRVEWELRPRGDGRDTPAPEALIASASQSLRSIGEAQGAAVYAPLHEDLESLSTDYFLRALLDMGWRPQIGESVSVAGMMERCGIAARHQKLVRRILRVLSAAEVLGEEVDGNWEVLAIRDPKDPDARAAELMARYAPHDAEFAVTARCGAGLAGVLLGEVDPLELLFPGGDTFAQARIYRDTPIAHAYNGAIRDVVLQLIAARSADRPLRILEIGAGTGGTTSHLANALPETGVEYTFTDIGRLFVNRAREAFGERPFMRFETLDIDRDPAEQGFEVGAYDLIIASNVLHATRLLRPTLQRVRRLLAPGGHLCLFEVTRERAWVDLTVGLLEGWWLFEDTDLRTENPVLDGAAWEALLRQEGFDTAVATGEADEASGLAGQALILARNSRAPLEDDARRWLVVAGESAAGREFAERLEREGMPVRLVEPGASPSRDDFERWIVAQSDGSFTDVAVFCDDQRASDAAEAPQAALRRTVGGVLHLVQALVGREGSPPRLHLVTRGGQAANGDVEHVDPAQAAIWGLARTIRLEHPELHCRCLDLDSRSNGWSEAAHLELTQPDRETEVAFRQDERRVARLLPVELPETADGAQRLVYGESGLLEDVHLAPWPRQAPGPREIEIEILAAGMNFRDVVHALGVRSDVKALGAECVGRVVARGGEVNHLSEGDLVLAAWGAFGDYAIVHADLAARIPASLSVLEAATLPITFLTAHRALQVAQMRAGQRILIHAAAGGVGMAAVQLAVAAGLEVYGTASTPEKREEVRKLGAREVFDSRSLSFEAEVMRATGGTGVDLVLNSLAGDFIPASLRVLAEGGTLVELGKTGIWTQDQVDAEAGVRPGVRYLPVDLSDDLMERPEVIRPALEELVQRVEQGELRPLPYRVFPLSRAEEAFRTMAAGRHTGKLILVPDGRFVVRADGSYLITGGFGGLGLLVAERLADRGARCILLSGRSEPGDEARHAIAALRERGVRVESIRADASDQEGLSRALAELDALPPLRGVIHSAGALRDGALIQQRWEDFEEVFRSKPLGVEALAAVAANAPLDFFLIFSSIAGTFGSPGQGNHSAANAYLDAFAVDRVARGLPAVSIAWGAWGETGAAVRHGVNTRAARKGIGTIDPQLGLRLMEELGAAGSPVAVVSPVRWETFLGEGDVPAFYERVAPKRRARVSRPTQVSQEQPVAPTRSFAEEFADLAPARRRPVLQERIRGAVRRVLGLPASFEIDDRQALGDIGLDSLMAVELRNALGQLIGRTLPATLLFDYPSVGALTSFLEPSLIPTQEIEKDGGDGGAESLADGAGGDDDFEALLGQIESLSEEEVESRMRKVEPSPHV